MLLMEQALQRHEQLQPLYNAVYADRRCNVEIEKNLAAALGVDHCEIQWTGNKRLLVYIDTADQGARVPTLKQLLHRPLQFRDYVSHELCNRTVPMPNQEGFWKDKEAWTAIGAVARYVANRKSYAAERRRIDALGTRRK